MPASPDAHILESQHFCCLHFLVKACAHPICFFDLISFLHAEPQSHHHNAEFVNKIVAGLLRVVGMISAEPSLSCWC